jgi:ribosomal protein L3 glutamine methyltransferase
MSTPQPEVTFSGLWDLAHKELGTVRDCLRFAVSRFNEAKLFFGHGSNNAHDEAAYLILHTLHLPPDTLELYLDATLTAPERDLVLAVLKRRVKERLPAAYLTHEAWLTGHRFYVDKRVIVPRSFIAELLQEQLAPWIADPASIRSVLDLCTGSGCLAILAALHFPDARVDAADISSDALDVAQRNIYDYHLQDRVRTVDSDMNSALKGRRYDLILSNPPYVTGGAMAALPEEYRHEPALALTSGEDGLDHVRVILGNAAQHLTDNGMLVVEIGHNREAVEAAFPALPFIWPETSAGEDMVFILRQADLRAGE